MKVRFRRFRLISIDTHLWSEHDKQENMYDGENRQVFSADVSSAAVNCSTALARRCRWAPAALIQWSQCSRSVRVPELGNQTT